MSGMAAKKFEGTPSPTGWVRLHRTLVGDVARARQQAEQTHNDADARSYVRAAFAYSEALSFFFRRMAHAMHFARDRALTEEELVLLQEVGPTVDDHGKVKLSRRWLSSEGGLLFGFRVLLKALGPPQEPPLGKGWENYRRGIDIRDRLTHPKTESDLDVSAADLETIHGAVQWINDLIDPVVPIVIKSAKLTRR